MNFTIKSVVYWLVFLIFISAVSTYLYNPVDGVEVAMTQFTNTTEAQAKLLDIEHKHNVHVLCIGAFWCLAIGVYVNMAIKFAKSNKGDKKEDEV